MDQRVRQAVAERLGLSGEAYDAWQAGDPTPLLAGRVSDPLLAMLLGSALHPPAADGEAEADTAERKLARARDAIRALKEDLAALETMVRYVAEVFGACETCWGRDPTCQRCSGLGKPGSVVPLEEELLAWAEPALHKLGLRVERGDVRGAPDEAIPTESRSTEGRRPW